LASPHTNEPSNLARQVQEFSSENTARNFLAGSRESLKKANRLMEWLAFFVFFTACK
jgi:hypothetical protein